MDISGAISRWRNRQLAVGGVQSRNATPGSSEKPFCAPLAFCKIAVEHEAAQAVRNNNWRFWQLCNDSCNVASMCAKGACWLDDTWKCAAPALHLCTSLDWIQVASDITYACQTLG